LREVLATGVKTARTSLGLRQEDAAIRVRQLGLPSWLRGTVAQVEVGARRLTLEELLVLALAYETTPAALIVGRDDELVELTENAWITVADLRALWTGQPAPVQAPARPIGAAAAARERLKAGRAKPAEPTEADRRAARRLGMTLEEATAAAMRRWGRTLAEERDRRLSERAGELSPRQLQAMRGHITRELLAELTTASDGGSTPGQAITTPTQPATRGAT
jgi:hypothetical protein